MAWNVQNKSTSQNNRYQQGLKGTNSRVNPFTGTSSPSPLSDEYGQQKIASMAASNGIPQTGKNPVYQAGMSTPVGYTDYDIDLGSTGWWNNGDTSKRDRFNDATNQANAAGRTLYGNDWNNIGGAVDIGWYDGNKSNNDWYGNYSRGNTGIDRAYNDWLRGNRFGSIDANDWNTQKKNIDSSYNNAMSNLGTGLDDYSKGFLDNYNPYADSSFYDIVDERNNQMYDDAKNVLDRDYKNGYLNYVGYNKALDELNRTTAGNRQGLISEGTNWYNNALNEMNQLRAKLFTQGVDSLESNPFASLQNYNALLSGNLGSLGSYDNAYNAIGDYANNYINDDQLMYSMNTNLYDPEQYVATGANEQGVWNPAVIGGRSRKRYGLDNIGEF